MTIVRVKGFKIFPDRHGHLRCYHRASGIPIDLAKAPIGSAEFFAECARVAALAGAKAAIDAPGTLGSLICDYRKSPLFHDLAPRTRADYVAIEQDWPLTLARRQIVRRPAIDYRVDY